MAISTTYTGVGETVVVIDSGWSSAWNTGRLVYQYDFADKDSDARNPDINTHGALVASSILAQAPDVGIIALKVIPDGSRTAEGATIEQALQWVAANAQAYHIAGVNLSLAGGTAEAETTTLLSDELAALAGQRVITAAAAGNAGQNGTTQDISVYAADHNEVCVSASTGQGGFPSWSQRSSTLTDLCADGTDIALTNLAGQTYTVNGSSFSAPAVTAAVALAQQEATQLRGSPLTQDEFLTLARASGTPLGSTGYIDLNTPALLARIAQTYPEPPVVDKVAATIAVNASGSVAGGVNAHFKVLVDGKAIGEAGVGTTAKDYSFNATVTAAAHKVQVQFDNDAVIGGQDRNLLVNTITINGHVYAATDSAVLYDKGALDGKDVAAGQSGMWWNGALVVSADKSLFAADTAQTAFLDVDSAQTAALEGHAAESLWGYTAATEEYNGGAWPSADRFAANHLAFEALDSAPSWFAQAAIHGGFHDAMTA